MIIEKLFVDNFYQMSIQFTTQLPKLLYWQSEAVNSVTGGEANGLGGGTSQDPSEPKLKPVVLNCLGSSEVPFYVSLSQCSFC